MGRTILSTGAAGKPSGYSSRMSAAGTSNATITPARALRGRLRVPGDKSISHRYAILAALADGVSNVTGYADGADCRATLRCLRALGVTIGPGPEAGDAGAAGRPLTIHGRGLGGLAPPTGPLDAGNSGTTMRLLAGVLAAHPFRTVITGDGSLRRRPMRRVIEPLARMGATLDAAEGRPPLTVHGGPLTGIEFAPPVASAQVKTAVLLAGLHAAGMTRVFEALPTRDHTERALLGFGAAVRRDSAGVTVSGGTGLRAADLAVPGDPSSAAFWAAAAAALPGSEVEIDAVGLNPTRTAYLDVLRRAGAQIETRVSEHAGGEPMGTLCVRHGGLRPVVVAPAEVPGLIDELPVLGALAALGGAIDVRGAAELRHKESDRIARLADGLRRLGARVEERPDGFRVDGSRRLAGGSVDAAGDHRLAMAFAVAALGAEGPSLIAGADAVDVSYPGFFAALDGLRAD